MTTKQARPADLHIFTAYTAGRIAELMGYDEEYIVKLKFGRKPISPLFKRKASRALGEPEAVLFAASEEEENA